MDAVAWLVVGLAVGLAEAAPQRAHDSAEGLRAAARRALADRLGVAQAAEWLGHDANGRPFLRGAALPAWAGADISFSYGPGVFALALVRAGRVGVDVQTLSPRQVAAFRQRFGTASPDLDPAQHWTRIEAIGKMLGRGLSEGPQRLCALAAEGSVPGRLLTECRLPGGQSLTLCRTEPGRLLCRVLRLP